MAPKVIIFDFDGTLADTYETFVEIANRLSDEFGYKPVDRKEQEKLKSLSARELIKQTEISPLKIPFVLKRVKSELNYHIKDLNPINDIPNCLKQLKEQGYLLGIITSNAQENVLDFLKIHKLDAFFSFIYAGTTLFGKHKIINKLLKDQQLMADEVIYVGDETRDINSAKKSRIKVIAVTWGFNAADVLLKHQPDFLINHPQELITILQKIKKPVKNNLLVTKTLSMEG